VPAIQQKGVLYVKWSDWKAFRQEWNNGERFRRGRRKEHSRARFNPDLPTVAFKPARKNCSDIALGVVYQDEFEEGNLTR
jgi:hypothetical protein